MKQMVVLGLVATNVSLLSISVWVYHRRGSMPDWYYRLLPLSPLLAAALVSLGFLFLSEGRFAPGMHLFYGAMVTLGVLGQLLVGLRSGRRQQYQARPVVHGFLALFVALLAARAWMSI